VADLVPAGPRGRARWRRPRPRGVRRGEVPRQRCARL